MLAGVFKDKQGNPERGFAGDFQGEGVRPPHTQGAGEAQPTPMLEGYHGNSSWS